MSNPIGTVPGYSPIVNQPGSTATGDVGKSVSKGTVGSGGGVTTVGGEQGAIKHDGFALSFSAIFAAPSLAPSRPAQFELVLAEVSEKLKATRQDTELESTHANQERIRTAAQERATKLEEQDEKLRQAEETRKVSGILGTIADVLGGIGIVAALAGAVTTTATAILTLNPVHLVTAATMWGMTALATYQFADGLVAKHTGNSILGHMMKAGGASDDQIKTANETVRWTLVGVQATLAVVAVGTAIAGAFTSPVLKVGQAAGAASAAVTLLSVASVTASLAGAGTQIATGVTGGAKAIVDYKTAEAETAAADKGAEAAQMDAYAQNYESLIDQALAMLMGALDVTNAMLDAAAGGLRDQGDSMMQVRFAG